MLKKKKKLLSFALITFAGFTALRANQGQASFGASSAPGAVLQRAKYSTKRKTLRYDAVYLPATVTEASMLYLRCHWVTEHQSKYRREKRSI